MKKKLLTVALVLCCVLALAACGGDTEDGTPATGDFTAQATEFTELFFAQDFDAIAPLMDQTMQESLTTDMLAETYTQLSEQLGAMTEIGTATQVVEEDYQIVYVNVNFEKQDISFRFTMDGEGLISGWFMDQPYSAE